jgi:hypothetical protein
MDNGEHFINFKFWQIFGNIFHFDNTPSYEAIYTELLN